jgi:phosphate-selective porin OprO/OprP
MRQQKRGIKGKFHFFKLCVIVGLLFHSSYVLADESFATGVDSFMEKTEIGGLLMLDYSLFDGNYINDPDDDNESNNEIRRARITFKHRLNKDWKAKLQINFDDDDNSVEIGDAYVCYKGLKGVDLTFGQMKEPFGLENMSSSKYTTFLERAMASNAFAPDRSKGVMASGSVAQFTWALGGYDVEVEDEDGDSEPYAVTGRFSWAPIRTKKQTLHFGIAGSWRDLDEDSYKIKESAEVNTAQEVINSGSIVADNLLLLGLEAAWINGPFSLQSEYMCADLQAVDASEDAIFDGYYVQTSYFLTGESRKYKKGRFKNVKPLSSSGAWELAARYSVLDTAEAKKGERGETTTLGVNYYYDDHVKVMANLLHSEVRDDDDGNAISFRIQYVF